MSVVANTLDGKRVADQHRPIGDNHREIRALCGNNRTLWLESAYLSLIDSGWNEDMLSGLQLNPQRRWYVILTQHPIRPPHSATPRSLAYWADRDSHRWSKLAMRTLKSRSWTLDMLAELMSISFATAFRWNRSLDDQIGALSCGEFESWDPAMPNTPESGIDATRQAAACLRSLADMITDSV